MRRTTKYVCPLCKATFSIVDDTARNGNDQLQPVPDVVPCGWRGCPSWAWREGYAPTAGQEAR